MVSETCLEEVISVKGSKLCKQGGHSSSTQFSLLLGATPSQDPQLWATQDLEATNPSFQVFPPILVQAPTTE